MKKLLTVPEVAQELGLTEKAIWGRIFRGQLPFRRWGGKVVVPTDELLAFIKELPGRSIEEAVAKAVVPLRRRRPRASRALDPPSQTNTLGPCQRP